MGNFSLTSGFGYVFRLPHEPALEFAGQSQFTLNATGFFDLANRVYPHVTPFRHLGHANPPHRSGFLHQAYVGGSVIVEPSLFPLGAVPADHQTNYGLAAHAGYALSRCFHNSSEQPYAPDSVRHQNTLSCRWTLQTGVRAEHVFLDQSRTGIGPEITLRVAAGNPDPNYFTFGLNLFSLWNPVSFSSTPDLGAIFFVGIRN